jgi:HK97 family phage portal protein
MENILPPWLLNLFTNRSGGKWQRFRQTYLLGQKGPVWINYLEPYEEYNSIPQLKLVIDKKASMFSNMQLKLVDKITKEEIIDHELHALLNNPNPLQSQNAFLKEFKMQEQVYGNQFIYKNKASRISKYPTTLYNVSARYMQPELSGKIFDQVSIDGIIERYKYRQTGQYSLKRDFKPSEILYSRIADLDNPIIGRSPIEALTMPLSNIKGAYAYRNVIITEKGAIGILSNEGKDAMGGIPISSEEKDKINALHSEQYGINEGQKRIILTEASLKWQPMSYPTKDLMLFEEVDANTMTIIDMLGLNVDMFSSKSSTYENAKAAYLGAYQDTIIPDADQFTQAFGKFIGIPDNTMLIGSYDHLSIMKESKLKGMQSIQSIVASLTQAVAAGIMSAEQAKIILSNELGLA